MVATKNSRKRKNEMKMRWVFEKIEIAMSLPVRETKNVTVFVKVRKMIFEIFLAAEKENYFSKNENISIHWEH